MQIQMSSIYECNCCFGFILFLNEISCYMEKKKKKKVPCHCSVTHISKNLTEVNGRTNNAHFF